VTQAPETRKFVKTNKRSKSSKVWIALSFTLSALILGWAFSLPFRQSDTSLVSSASTEEQSEAFRKSEQIRERRSNADEFRQAAIALDEKFMQSIREKRDAEKRRPRPGINESREHWQRHLKLVKKELQTYRYAKEGTVEWDHKQSLLKSLADAPR
jgi:hypothetical protein